jgi:hypothetical protein
MRIDLVDIGHTLRTRLSDSARCLGVKVIDTSSVLLFTFKQKRARRTWREDCARR